MTSGSAQLETVMEGPGGPFDSPPLELLGLKGRGVVGWGSWDNSRGPESVLTPVLKAPVTVIPRPEEVCV